MKKNYISVKGARENNLKNIDIEIPKDKFVVITGLSGSGKSSLAFDTIYAEGQRKYVESLSAYARQFLGGTEKPDVDSIEGLSPSISIDQKTTSKNPRSTVGTITEIYDYLRLLYARVGIPYCPTHKEPISSQSIEEMLGKVLELEDKTKIQVLAPVVSGQKGTHKKEIDSFKVQGFTKIRVNGEVLDVDAEINLEKNKKHTIEVVIDRLVIKKGVRSRLADSIETALNLADGKVLIDVIDGNELLFSEKFACKYCDFSLPELEPRMFSFNSPFGACPDCKGLGTKLEIDHDLVVPDKSLSIAEGAIKPIGPEQQRLGFIQLKQFCDHFDIDIYKPFKELSKKEVKLLFFGSNQAIKFNLKSKSGMEHNMSKPYEGIINTLNRRHEGTSSSWSREYYQSFMNEHICSTCNGKRLRESVLNIFVGGININQVTELSIKKAKDFFDNLDLSERQAKISLLILKEIDARLTFLINVGLDYLNLSRMAGSLSGGEAQRIRLATQIGSRLTGVLYVLDEPSIGLHQRDNRKLIDTLKGMRDIGNTLLVVEHDEETMIECDYLIDIGPGAGVHGGEVIAMGTPKQVMRNKKSITGQYLSGQKYISIPETRRKGNGKFLEVRGAKENNLKGINVKFPLNKFICVTGVSGSGKSSLVNQILYKSLAHTINRSKVKPGEHKEIKGLDNIDKVVNISQSPIGRTPRSNPATYTGVFDPIRDLFASLPDSKIRGYQKGRFSFNVKGGRCESCNGDGVTKIEMHFLPDVYVPCDVCKGKRYNSETLDIRFKGKNIYDVLEMTVEDALSFFENHPRIKRPIQTLFDVGLGYIKLGQAATTLSGGEAQRVKLAKELQKRATGKTVFILDEPTTGLHVDDVSRLIKVLNRIVDNNDTVIVIEHNLDIIKVADHIIDLGPEGGELGGEIVATGTPEQVIEVEGSYTGYYLKDALEKREI